MAKQQQNMLEKKLILDDKYTSTSPIPELDYYSEVISYSNSKSKSHIREHENDQTTSTLELN